MQDQAILVSTWSDGLAALVYVLFGAFLLGAQEGGERQRAVAALRATVFLCGGWGVVGFAFALTGKPIFRATGGLLDVLRYGGWYAVLLLLVWNGRSQASGEGRRLQRLLLAAIAVTVSGLLVRGGAGSVASRAELFHSLAMIGLALALTGEVFRRLDAESRRRVQPLCLGLAGAFAFDLYLYSDAALFDRFDQGALDVRGLVHASVVPLLARTALRRHHGLATLRLSQNLAIHSAALVLVAAYLGAVAVAAYYLRHIGGDWGRALLPALLFAALMLLAVTAFSPVARMRLRVLLSKHFFSYRYDYREEWLRFTRTLSAQISPAAMEQQVIRGLAEMVDSPAGGLWRKEGSRRAFRQSTGWNMDVCAAAEDVESSFCRFLEHSGWLIDVEEYRAFPARYRALQMPAWLGEIADARLIVPLLSGRDLVGFVILARGPGYIDVDWEVTDLLKTAGRQAASFLAQMQAAEDLVEARRFDAFNRMSAFVVHDLKTIISQLSLMLKNAERHRGNPEFEKDMLATVEHSVERMRQLMTQLREGLTPSGDADGVDLAAVVRRIQAMKAAQGRNIAVEICEVFIVRCHEERIERVISHLVQNAIEATDASGRVWIKLDRCASRALIEIGDTGQGMSDEFIRERLFRPFQTTKPNGLGLGAYESFHYVQELGGEVLVDSQIGAGTRIRLLLPVFDVPQGSGLQQREVA